MTPEAQRIAIAEVCGWRLTETDITYPSGLKIGCHPPEYVREVFLKTIPDYLNDLNAMHEAEKVLAGFNESTGDSQYGRYITALQKITNWNRVPCATAAQRSEAFLRTLNLWKE